MSNKSETKKQHTNNHQKSIEYRDTIRVIVTKQVIRFRDDFNRCLHNICQFVIT